MDDVVKPGNTLRLPKKIAVVSAMPEELSAVLSLMPDESAVECAGRKFWVGHLHGHEVVAVLSHIGKVAAALTTTLLIERFGVNAVVLTGVAGGLGDGVRVGDMVVGDVFLQHDMDASPIFPRFTVPYNQSHFAAQPELTQLLAAAASRLLANPVAALGEAAVAVFGLQNSCLHRGLIISGDQFISSSQVCKQLRADLPDALAVEMEGAAIAQVCHDMGVPFAAVRTISDRADDMAHVDFPRFIDQVAMHYSAGVIENLLKSC